MTQLPSISVEELHRRMNSGEKVFVLDVRGAQAYSEWKINHKNLTSVNITNSTFLKGDERTFDPLPKDQDIIVVCAKGKTAQEVTNMLLGKGYRAVYLEGGMESWSQFYYPTTVTKDDKMEVIQINRLAKGCLSYMIVSEGTALVIDPSIKTDVYTKLAAEKNAKVAHIMDSHCHADHISGGSKLASETGATYYISSSEVQGTNLKYEPLEKHDSVKFGSVEVEVIPVPTPGHTPGSTSFFVNRKYLMSGDTIFVGGLGRPDLGGKAKEWAEDLYDTVFKKVSDMPDDVFVLPAHFGDISEINDNGIVGATLGEIRDANEIMRTTDRAKFTETVASAASTLKPPNFEEIVSINRGEIFVDMARAAELEIGPNRCAVHHAT
ncbi:MBL fold metallo-hydrolase [Ferviditalea candida]|uniref:MBL fold metallo-hydrolase n=1 Tax=Ferviditalea candida TaxID=3108399 RepID=A0ABU5ZGE7_9BACL|nr:MBL fold metallo-hydrolase [Paenibacillaceae bacterium T2]